MHRRTLLRRTGALGALALAGCMGQGANDDGGDGASGDPSPTPSPTPTPPPVTVRDTDFQVTGRGGASSEQGSADVEFDTENNRVVLTGTIVGSDGCKTAALGDATYDPEADELRVDVVTKDRADSEVMTCTQALVAIDYELVVSFDGGVPKRTSVAHDGQGIVSGGHDSASAGEPAGPRVTDRSFEVTDSGNASSEAGSAVVSFPDTDTVRVEGTILGSNGCKTADLASLAYDAEGDELVVDVVTTDRPDAGDSCTQALVGIDYVATATLAGGLPGEVSVTHDGEQVETATYQG